MRVHLQGRDGKSIELPSDSKAEAGHELTLKVGEEVIWEL